MTSEMPTLKVQMFGNLSLMYGDQPVRKNDSSVRIYE